MHVSDCVARVLQPLDYSAQDLNTRIRCCYLNILAVGTLRNLVSQLSRIPAVLELRVEGVPSIV